MIQHIKQRWIALYVIILLISLHANALKEDNFKKIQLNANLINFQYLKRTVIYQGNVTAHQGTTELNADRMIVHYNSKQKITKVDALGSPAHYSTDPSANKARLHAFAKKITYYPLEGRVELRGDCRITQNDNEFSGPFIVFDMKKESVVSYSTERNKTKIIIEPLATFKSHL